MSPTNASFHVMSTERRTMKISLYQNRFKWYNQLNFPGKSKEKYIQKSFHKKAKRPIICCTEQGGIKKADIFLWVVPKSHVRERWMETGTTETGAKRQSGGREASSVTWLTGLGGEVKKKEARVKKGWQGGFLSSVLALHAFNTYYQTQYGLQCDNGRYRLSTLLGSLKAYVGTEE